MAPVACQPVIAYTQRPPRARPSSWVSTWLKDSEMTGTRTQKALFLVGATSLLMGGIYLSRPPSIPLEDARPGGPVATETGDAPIRPLTGDDVLPPFRPMRKSD